MVTSRKKATRSSSAKIVGYTKRGAEALASLQRNVRDTATLAANSSSVINARLADVNTGELVRMGPEKVLAAMSAGAAWMRAACRLSTVLYRDAAEEAAATVAAAQEIAGSPLPFAFGAQYRAMHASMERATARSFAVADEILRAQRDVMLPYRAAAGANARRLARAA